MSWSISASGSKQSVVVAVTQQFDQQASNYGGGEEGDDIKAVKARVLALVDAIVLGDGEVVLVSANGSHGTDARGIVSAEANLRVVITKG
jgi:hypothetical protein